ncbi:hypothetical protein HY635_03490 [Candidatus Uhrbacteria bacterium]|nr:hypothetical protein [Candidatus Uhrbacteria bacterium]
MSFVPLSRSQLEFIAEEFWPGGGENDDGRDLYGVAKHHGVWVEKTTDADLIAEAMHPADADYYDRHRVDEMSDEEYERFCDEDESDVDGEHISVNGESFEDWLWEREEQDVRVGPEPEDVGGDDPYGDLDGEDGPDTLELALTRQIAIDPWCVVVPRRWNENQLLNNEGAGEELEDIGAKPVTPTVASALERFERDGIRQIASRRAARAEYGWCVRELRDKRRRWGPNIGPHYWFDPVRKARYQGRGRGDSWKRHRDAQYRPVLVNTCILARAA